MHHPSWFNRFGLLCLLSFLAFSFANQTPVSAQTDCAGTLPSRLTVGGYGRVTPGDPNNVRDIPKTNGQLVGTIPPGASFQVSAGPQCSDGFNWWQIHTSDFDGWTVESSDSDYWLAPYAPDFTVTTRDGITHVQYKEAHSISFDFLSTLAVGVKNTFSIAEWNSQSPLPEYVCFDFQLDPPQEYPYDELCVFETKGMETYVQDLQKVLADKPAFDNADPQARIPIPFNGAAQLVQSQLRYFGTDMVNGVGFVTFYAQNYFPITNNGLEYNYSGLTTDGKFIVYFAYRISSNVLSSDAPTNSEIDAVAADPLTYYKSIVDKLNATSPVDFTPHLDMLAGILKSLAIE
ncbi:MAG: hypothetical protein ABI970_01525 [Chloroflexota bacterium]